MGNGKWQYRQHIPIQKFKVWQLGTFWLPCRKGKIGMFNFRIIPCADGTEIIDTTLKTPYESLTPSQMVDYVETDKTLTYMDRMEEKAYKRAERKRKMRNPLYRLACMCGLA